MSENKKIVSENKKIIAERLKKLLELKNISQADLERKSGVSKATISKAINEGILSVKIAKLISKALGVSLDYLYGNSDIESIPKYAFDIIMRHISSYNCRSVWGGDSVISTISLSQPLSVYLEAICDAGKAKTMPEHVRKNWLQDEKERFLQAIENDKEQKLEYALIRHEFLTDKVLKQLEVAMEEIKGEIPSTRHTF